MTRSPTTRRRARAIVALAVLAALSAPAAPAQPGDVRWIAGPSPVLAPSAAPRGPRTDYATGEFLAEGADVTSERAPRRLPWWGPLASAVVPGSGQAVFHSSRALPYLAVEAYVWSEYLHARDEGRGRRQEYQRLAQIARAFFSDSFPAGSFEYYERMQHFVESGLYDRLPGGVLDPETDTATFNGSTWLLARRTFWQDPDSAPPRDSDQYRRAVQFYRQRAIRPEFQWSWRGARLEQDVYARTIQRSNSAFRLSSEYLGVIIANHVLSAVDAFVVLRLSSRHVPERQLRLDGTVPWAPFGRPSRPRASKP